MEATGTLPRLLRPRFARDWPERAQGSVNVLCEGPGVLEASRKDLLPGPVVAVNHTVALSGDFPIDCWATVDDPRNLWEWGKPLFPKGAKIFTTENNIPIWHSLLGLRAFNRRVYAPAPVFMEALDETGEGYVGEDGKPPLLPTVIHVLGWLSRLGAKRVRLIGCDMRGEGSPLSSVPFNETAGEGASFRWSVERTLIGICIKTYKAQGKLLERWSPKKDR